ncbi:exocyst complex component 3-like protein [Pleurodeles waltl]|uniref:exocyst complex component 3-like protein n=1 Tax=Pleurodeles waltl TaxID=8319 RepID=UPI003709B766
MSAEGSPGGGPAEEGSRGDGSAGEEWPELEKAEKLARGAALKWASGMFYRPDQLEGLSHYRKREVQRNNSIQSRLKSVIQSYLEGVGMGVKQLHSALEDVRSAREALAEVRQEWDPKAECLIKLESLREVVSKHAQLSAVVCKLPHVFSLPEAIAETHRLIDGRHLLESHTKLMELECWRDDILRQITRACGGTLSAQDQNVVLSYFAGVQELSEELAQELWDVVVCGTTLVRKDPTLFVSAVRIIEREEKIDSSLLEGSSQHRFLPPGRPKAWRQAFFRVTQESIAARFRATQLDIRGHGLARHLAALQNNILDELNVVTHLMVQCCPPHYHIVDECVAMYHKNLVGHLQQILTWELEKSETFAVLNWTLNVYPSEEMMRHPDLYSEVDISTLGPLLAPEVIEQLQRRYVQQVKADMVEWMQKTLEVEFSDWFRDEEPELDHEGFYQSTLPVIILQILDENVRVAAMISDSLRQKMVFMAVHEFDSFLSRLKDALVEYEKEHDQDASTSKYYVPYLLTTINNCLQLSSSISFLEQDETAASGFWKSLPSLHSALDRTQKKACRLLVDDLMIELQPFFVHLPSRNWLSGIQIIDNVCGVTERYCRHFSRARNPGCKFLLSECERMVVIEYIRGFMQKRLQCKNPAERVQAADHMSQEAQQLEELFSRLGLPQTEQCVSVILGIQELLRLQDPNLLSLEVSGFTAKYPDISDDHISALLEFRGDVSRDVRNLVLEMMQQNPRSPPGNYQPIFTHILVPAPLLSSCLRSGKCA